MHIQKIKSIIVVLVFLFLSFEMTKAQQAVTENSGKIITVFTIGDSTMANKKAEVAPETGWCQVFQTFVESTVLIKNRAVNGRSTKSFINEGRWKSVFDSLQAGDYVFIQFGHNDEKIQDSTRYTEPFTGYRRNLELFVRETREKGATPILFTSIVRRQICEWLFNRYSWQLSFGGEAGSCANECSDDRFTTADCGSCNCAW